jgi:hypothetical protein
MQYLLIAQNADGYEPVAIVTPDQAAHRMAKDYLMRTGAAFAPEDYALWEISPTGARLVRTFELATTNQPQA